MGVLYAKSYSFSVIFKRSQIGIAEVNPDSMIAVNPVVEELVF
jgi:hypothetical protein